MSLRTILAKPFWLLGLLLCSVGGLFCILAELTEGSNALRTGEGPEQ